MENPCEQCVVRPSCTKGCEEFIHFLKNNEYVKQVLDEVSIDPGGAGFRTISNHIRKSGMNAYEYIENLNKFTKELGIRDGRN